ncbi:MAG: flagellar hook-basal body complex protein [Burkholderiaceae bacterium]
MDRLAFNAVAAINEQRVARQMTTNELANVSTIGFKRSFEAAVRAISVEGSGMPTRQQPQSFTQDYISMKAGSLMATGNKLDIALSGSTVLGVSAPDGQLAFTRRGDLRLNATGTLENGSGHPVRGQGGAVITAPPGLSISIQSDGSVYGDDPAQVGVVPAVLLGNLLLRDASQIKLQRREDGLYQVVGEAAGQDIAPGPHLPGLTAGALEGSNVNALEVMVKLMDQSRSFEQQINMIKESKTCDESGETMMKSS